MGQPIYQGEILFIKLIVWMVSYVLLRGALTSSLTTSLNLTALSRIGSSRKPNFVPSRIASIGAIKRCANSDGVQTKSESLLEDQMVESVPQVKFEKEDGFLAIMDTDLQVKFKPSYFFISITMHYKTS